MRVVLMAAALALCAVAQAHALPTTVKAGYPNSDYNFWVGALVAAKTPQPIVERLQFQSMIDQELGDNAELIKKTGIKGN